MICQHLDDHGNIDCNGTTEHQVCGVWLCWDHDHERTARLARKSGRMPTVDESRFL